MGVWEGMWQAAQSGLMFVLGAGVLLSVAKFILRLANQAHLAEMAQILVTITIVGMIIVGMFGLLDDVDKNVKKGRPAPTGQQTPQGR